ncbi:Putative TEGT family carrier/transport protein [Salmonella enterica subsp. enterica]|nr:Putative TEGT family carrier/transport protein [Salmonella enterica subsp. enterica]SUG93904.1 Putative TEGT family carrier/transport protein [Salmonella enterica subsp. enterica]
MDRIITSSRDRSSLLSTHKVLRNTYFLLSLTLAFSAITATASTVLMLPSPRPDSDAGRYVWADVPDL